MHVNAFSNLMCKQVKFKIFSMKLAKDSLSQMIKPQTSEKNFDFEPRDYNKRRKYMSQVHQHTNFLLM